MVTSTFRGRNSSKASSRQGQRRKNDSGRGNPGGRRKRSAIDLLDSNVESDDSSDDEGLIGASSAASRQRQRLEQDVDDDDEDDRIESMEARKIRLAREYLSKIEGDEDDMSDEDGEDDEDDDESLDETSKHNKLSQRLAKDRLKRQGYYEQNVAKDVQSNVEATLRNSILCRDVPESALDLEKQAMEFRQMKVVNTGESNSSSDAMSLWKGHDLTVTCIDMDQDGHTAFSGSKDNSVLSWDIETETCKATIIPQWKKQQQKHPEHQIGNGEILSVAVSDDGRYLATGGRDALVRIFDLRLAGSGTSRSAKSANVLRSSSTNGSAATRIDAVTTFRGHKGPISSLTFRSRSSQLFSGSYDGNVRAYSLDEMMLMDTLYGHQAGVSGLDCMHNERPISVGRDRTARAWKLAESTHLIFREGSRAAAADCISMIKEDWFLTGHDDGFLSLWFTGKKKAIRTVRASNDLASSSSTTTSTSPMISCVDALKGSDFAISGSRDGYLRMWEVSTGKSSNERGLEALTKIPMHGFLNGIKIGPEAKFCVVATGQEHRLGRWEKVKRAKNRVALVRLRVP